ncbi:hypothetical protein [Desulfosporosinus youngiae]|uniref:hypothetical protein n=1 Tax=Desulfosporosinus youngiae TaxID=339862 RepID=UPI001FA7F509|nr:hypothetical protein [Desulfosporosinus youngiae]
MSCSAVTGRPICRHNSLAKSSSKHQSNACPAREVSNYRIRNIVYEGFYNSQPDHDYQNVIENCKKHLIEMKYIPLAQQGQDDYIFVDKPLDFLLPGEHEAYLKKFGIEERSHSKAQVPYTIQYHAITDKDVAAPCSITCLIQSIMTILLKKCTHLPPLHPRIYHANCVTGTM